MPPGLAAGGDQIAQQRARPLGGRQGFRMATALRLGIEGQPDSSGRQRCRGQRRLFQPWHVSSNSS
jgi:hypothetical protein